MPHRMDAFFFTSVKYEMQVKGSPNLWTQGQVQQRFQIDVRRMEELFCQDQRQSQAKATRGGKTRGSFRDAREEVSILDTKRGMNVGIFLKQFKRSNQTMVDDIRHGNSESFGAEPLRELLKLLPETDEVRKLNAYGDDVSKLPLADSFMHLLIQVPSYSVRIESMLLKEEFPSACDVMKQDFQILRTAVRELMSCTELHAVLHLVLQAGNILNAGGYAGNALGFKLSSLLSLADTKANAPGMNLLHFVALEAQKKDENLLEFPHKLSNVQAASRISLESLDAEIQLLASRANSIEESIQRDTELLQQLDDFLQSATSSLCSLRGSRQQLTKEGSELIDFFCEDRDTFRLDDCFSIFHSFCSKFRDAVKENMKREAKVAARRRQIQDQEEQKRHSWAGGEQVGGAYGTRRRSEADVSSAMLQDSETGLLLELITPKSHARSPHNSHSPSGRPGSLRRTRNSPSTSPSIAAERELCFLLELGSDQKISNQKAGVTRTASPPAPPELRPRLLPPRVIEPQTTSVTNCLGPENTNHTASTYLSCDEAQTLLNTPSNANKLKFTNTSESYQCSDHNNNENDQLSLGFSNQDALSYQKTPNDSDLNVEQNKDEHLFSRQIAYGEENIEDNTATTKIMPVVLETCTLVAELKGFDQTGAFNSCQTSQQQDGLINTALEDEGTDKSEGQFNSQLNGNAEKSNVLRTTQQEDERDKDDKIVVCCVTGVCEVSGENTFAPPEKDQCSGDNHGLNQHAASAPPNHKSLEPQSANVKPPPVPISRQPVPASRSDSALPTTYSRRCPAEPAIAKVVSVVNTDASEEVTKVPNQVKGTEESANQDTSTGLVPEQSKDGSCKSKMTPKRPTKDISSTGKKVVQQTGIKPSTTKTTSSAGRSKPIRTLTKSENQDIRRVVPIIRTNLTKQPEKSPSHLRSSCKIVVPPSVTVSNGNNVSFHQGKRPATAPSSLRSNAHKILVSKDLKDHTSSGSQASVQEQNHDLQKKSSIRKPLKKSKNQNEEKICRTTLRALSLNGGGSSVSAPVSPLHKTSPSSLLPGFARSTASFSFRRTHTTLPTSTPPHPPNTGYPKPSTMTPSSTCSTAASPGLTRTRPLRVPASSKSPDISNSSHSSTLKRSPNIKSFTRPPLHSALAPPQGHGRNDSGSFSDKSTHSKDSGKSNKPSWR
ncbi:FH2 domain-containing protein 1-like [Cololabis saira]|uniref:FH2 domain-containing protein 1-like n=1 Tax=Cololabis saira TaxID=129043 RepID=UPI002AD57752|nr:FH2 domain-containing protein 1-like [Cololabis saira]